MNLKIHPIKEIPTIPFWMLMILVSLWLHSCTEFYHKKIQEKFPYQAGISAPCNYPIGAVNVSFGTCGAGSITNFDNGWGDEHGGFVSGDKYKDIPKKVNIKYTCAVDNLTYEGEIELPYSKLKELFNTYQVDDSNSYTTLIVGMAPGGWIRVWFHNTNSTTEDIVLIEVLKAKLQGKEDKDLNEAFKNKKSDYWKNYLLYWQRFGVPYEVWENNEKEYTIDFNFVGLLEKKLFIFGYKSADGTNFLGGRSLYFGQKLPTYFFIIHGNKRVYNKVFFMPKSFKKYIEKNKIKKFTLQFEYENNDKEAILYLLYSNKKIKLLKIKLILVDKNDKKDKNPLENVEYYME